VAKAKGVLRPRKRSARANCHTGVKTELNKKMDATRSAQAARASTTFAAR